MVIRSIKHRGIRRFVEADDPRDIGGDMVNRVRNILAAIIVADDMSAVQGPPGWRIPTDRRQGWDMEHLGLRELADHFRDCKRGDRGLELGGLSLMTTGPVKIGMKPPHPGTFVREEILEPLGLSVARAAEALDVRRATLSDLVNGNAAVSPEMALRIEKAFGVNMDSLLKMQAWYDTCAMRERAAEIKVRQYVPHQASR